MNKHHLQLPLLVPVIIHWMNTNTHKHTKTHTHSISHPLVYDEKVGCTRYCVKHTQTSLQGPSGAIASSCYPLLSRKLYRRWRDKQTGWNTQTKVWIHKPDHCSSSPQPNLFSSAHLISVSFAHQGNLLTPRVPRGSTTRRPTTLRRWVSVGRWCCEDHSTLERTWRSPML